MHNLTVSMQDKAAIATAAGGLILFATAPKIGLAAAVGGAALGALSVIISKLKIDKGEDQDIGYAETSEDHEKIAAMVESEESSTADRSRQSSYRRTE